MKATKSNGQLMSEGRQLEGAGRLEDAAAAYQKVVDTDPRHEQAVDRLLVIYRKLKEYRKELAVIDAVLTAAQQRGKSAQQKWIEAHPGAAKLGKAVLRQLGGESASGYGTDPMVEKMLKRRAVVEKRIGGPAAKKKKPVGKATASKTSRPPARRTAQLEKKKVAAAARRDKAEQARQAKAEKAERARREKAEKAERVKQEKAQKADRAREAKEAKAEQIRQAKEAKAEQARKAKAEKAEKAHPSLFVVSIRYLVGLDKIDAAMPKHAAFLDKYFKAGNFLFAGRQVPRTGGIIITRGKDRAAVERIMKQDPFVKGRLASFDIVEFVASRVA